METAFKEKFSNVVVRMVKPIINRLLKKEIHVVANGDKITRDRDPFILISNHFNTWDSFIVMQNIDYNIRFVSTEMAFLDKSKKWGMSVLARVIPKRVGKVDVVATRKILEYLENGYAIGLFPEGDNTFYGETLGIFKASGKLLKKAGVDIVLVKQEGGYISQPRWADNFAKKGVVHTNTTTLITKEELKTMSVPEIGERIKKHLYNNDYEYQRTHMIERPGKKLAEGFDNVVYICPECETTNSIVSHDNEIICTQCNTIGSMNKYGFIEGFKYDNLVDWNNFQKPLSHKLLDDEFKSEAILYHVDYDMENRKRRKIGNVILKYKNYQFEITGASNETIPFEEIKNPIITLRRMLNFTYNNKSYILKLEHHVMAFLRVVQEKY